MSKKAKTKTPPKDLSDKVTVLEMEEYVKGLSRIDQVNMVYLLQLMNKEVEAEMPPVMKAIARCVQITHALAECIDDGHKSIVRCPNCDELSMDVVTLACKECKYKIKDEPENER